MLPQFHRAFGVALGFAACVALSTQPLFAATNVTLDPASATSPIEVRGDATVGDGDSSPHTHDAGISFANRAGASATSIDFTWLFLDPNGEPIGEEHTSTRGRFKPNVPVANNAAARVRFTGYATGDELFVNDTDTNAFEPVQQILVAVDNATFADGSSWHGKTRQTFAPPTQATRDATADAAHIRILKVQSTRANSLYDHVDTALSFANDNKKRIAQLEFVYTFYNQDGDVIYHQLAQVRGANSHGAISTLNPATRVNYRGVVMNGGSVWIGWGSEAQYVATIVAGVDSITYTDGTTWTPN